MKPFYLFIFLLFGGIAFGQKGKYELRITESSASCLTQKAVFQVDIRAVHVDSVFKMGNATLRFNYPTTVLANPILKTHDNFSNEMGDFNYDLMEIVNQSGSGSDILTMNIIYLGSAKGAKLVGTDWVPIGSIEFDMVPSQSKCYNLNWYNTNDFPSSGLDEVLIVTTSPFVYNLFSGLAKGFFNLSSCLNLPKPTATISGTQVIAPGGSANLSVSLTGISPWNVKLSDGSTNTATVSPLVVSVSPSQTTSYAVTEVSDGCEKNTITTGTATITVDPCANAPMPTASITGTATITAGSSTNLSVSLGGSSGPWTIVLSDGSTHTATTSPYIISKSPATTTTYTVSSVASSCKTNTSTTGSAVITVQNPQPNLSAILTGSTAIMVGQMAQLKVSIGDPETSGPWVIKLSNGVTYQTNVTPFFINVSPSVTSSYSIVSISNGVSTNTNLTNAGQVIISVTNEQESCNVRCSPVSYKVVKVGSN